MSCDEECAPPDECVNDDSVQDEYSDTCTSWYDANPDACGDGDTDDFVAAELCCACGGGSDGTMPCACVRGCGAYTLLHCKGHTPS